MSPTAFSSIQWGAIRKRFRSEAIAATPSGVSSWLHDSPAADSYQHWMNSMSALLNLIVTIKRYRK